MLDKFTNWVKTTSHNLSEEVKKFKNKSFLEATIAGCALVAAADGQISNEEKRKMVGFINQNEALKIFDTNEVIALFEKYCSTFEFDWEVGKGQALKTIAALKKTPDSARLMIRVCCAIGAADGNFDESEKKVVRDICHELGQDPSDFSL